MLPLVGPPSFGEYLDGTYQSLVRLFFTSFPKIVRTLFDHRKQPNDMATLHLHVKDSILEKVLGILAQFDKSEVEVVGEDADWWERTSAAEKASIKRGIAQADAGKGISHEEAMKPFGKWL
jgi:predicted transcriptional regulator